jgi:hypothetical protein
VVVIITGVSGKEVREMKKENYLVLFLLVSAFVLVYTFLAFSQPPIKPMEPAPRPRPDFQPSKPPSGIQPPAYSPPCEGWIEVIQPVTIKYPGRFREETITLNQNERKLIQIPESSIPAELKVTYRLKNKTNYYLRLDNLWIRYGDRGGVAHPPLNFTPFEQKNIEQKIVVNEGSGGQYRYFGIGGPRGCRDDALMIFFNAYLMIYIIVL